MAPTLRSRVALFYFVGYVFTVSVVSFIGSVVGKSGPVEVMSLPVIDSCSQRSVVKKPSSGVSRFVIVFSDNSAARFFNLGRCSYEFEYSIYVCERVSRQIEPSFCRFALRRHKPSASCADCSYFNGSVVYVNM